MALAQSNGADDTITVEPGTYNVTTPLTYTPNENQALTLHGGEGGITTLEGGGAVQILKIDTSGLPDDANANIRILYINFQKGKSQSVGGAGLSVKTSTASILVEGCVFQENIGNGQGGGGLHISATDGRIDIIHSIFTTNSGPIIGGGAYLESVNTEVHIANSHFTGNASTQYAGGVYAASSTGDVILVNNIVSGNSSKNGGGIWTSTTTGKVNLVHNTCTDNVAVADGGGALVTLGDDSGDAYLYNNILWNNTAGSKGNDLYVDDDWDMNFIGGTVDIYHNAYSIFEINVGDHINAGENIAEDPMLNAEFKLQEISPCIDAGMNTMPYFPDFDFEGDERNIDGDLNGEAVVDMGADEYKPIMALPAGQNNFTYLPVETPFAHTDPSRAKPISVGDMAGGTLDLAIRFLSFSAPADIYIGFSIPYGNPNDIYLLTPGNVFQLFDKTLTPYMSHSEGNIEQPLFGTIPTADLPPGTYYIHLLVTPAGDLTSYYFWTTYFVMS